MDPNRYPIAELVPHDHPMILIDRLLQVDESSARSFVCIREDNLLLDEKKQTSASIGIEWMAQTIAAHAGYQNRESGKPVEIGFLLGTRSYQAKRGVFSVGESFEIQVNRLYMDDGMAAFECQIEQGEDVLVTATVNTYQPGADKIAQIIGEQH